MIDTTDRALLELLDRHPTMAFRDLASRLGVSERTVSRRYQSLRTRRLVRVVGRTLPHFGDQVAWLFRARSLARRTEALGTALAGHDRTRWVRATPDYGELVFGLVSPTATGDGILQRLPDLPGVRSITPYQLLQVWAMHGEAVLVPSAPLDPVDRALITELSHDGRASSRELGRRIRVDETTIARRRARLEESGVLYYEADIPQHILGRSVDAMLWMSVAPGRLREAGSALQALPECHFVAVTSGPTTLVANVATDSTSSLVDLVETHLAGVVAEVEVLPLGRTFKRMAGTSTPV